MIKLVQENRPDKESLFIKPEEFGDVRAWSYSALKTFEECPYRTYIQRVRRVKEITNPAAKRGSDIHQQAEEYVDGTLEEMPDTLHKFKSEFEELRALFVEGRVELEGEWGFDIDWATIGWMESTTWARIKLDALVKEDETSARVIDYKTGRKFGNEMSHGQQCLLYAIAAFFRYPHLETVQTELWYLDKAETTKKFYIREEAMHFAPGFHKRAIAMTTCTDFAPTPNKISCRWCSYGKGDDPECQWSAM